MYPHLCEAIADGGLGFDLRQAVFLFILFCHTDLNQPMINLVVWGSVVWDSGVTPKYDSSLSFSGIPFMSKLPSPKPPMYHSLIFHLRFGVRFLPTSNSG